MRILSGFVSGLLFGVGLLISGMINPAKVLGFLDVAGTWDPTLAFVMAGALAVSVVAYRVSKAMRRPLFDIRFHLPTAKMVDPPLVAGAVIFGIGWGLVGFCPGPALAGLGSLNQSVLIFVAAMIAGMAIWAMFDRKRG
ncbi:MAG: YeeE/YedE family protein [Rhodospirillales bacterium]